MDPAPTCFFAAHHPKRLAPLQPKSIYIFDIGRREWLPDPIEGHGDVLPQPQHQHGVEAFLFQMDGNKLASVWCYPYDAPGGFGCELHWSKFDLRCVQDHNSSHPRFHANLLSHGYSDVEGNCISNCTAIYDIGSKTRKRATSVHPDILENAALENFDGVDKHVSKKLQVDKLSQVSSALSATRHQEFVSAQYEAVKKLQDEAEKPKELNSSLVSKLKDSVERDSKSFVNLFTAYCLEGFRARFSVPMLNGIKFNLTNSRIERLLYVFSCENSVSRIFLFFYSFIVILVVLLAFFILSIFMVRCAY